MQIPFLCRRTGGVADAQFPVNGWHPFGMKTTDFVTLIGIPSKHRMNQNELWLLRDAVQPQNEASRWPMDDEHRRCDRHSRQTGPFAVARTRRFLWRVEAVCSDDQKLPTNEEPDSKRQRGHLVERSNASAIHPRTTRSGV